MARRDLTAAVRDYLEPLHQALGCITFERLALVERTRFQPNTAYAVLLRNFEPVPLRAPSPLRISIAQTIRIVADQRPRSVSGFRAEMIQYFFGFSTLDGREILGYHWTPDAVADNTVTFPHLHIGRAIIGGQAAIRPRDLHKAHIPTGNVSVPAMVRLAIVEFGVFPLRPNWAEILERGETTT